VKYEAGEYVESRLFTIANALKVEILPLTWQPALETLG